MYCLSKIVEQNRAAVEQGYAQQGEGVGTATTKTKRYDVVAIPSEFVADFNLTLAQASVYRDGLNNNWCELREVVNEDIIPGLEERYAPR